MSDLEVLRELTGQFRPPEYDDLVTVARKRRRHSAVGVAAGAATVILAVGIAGAALSGGQREHEPAPNPTPTETPSMNDERTLRTLERVLAEGSPVGLLDNGSGLRGETGLDAQLYCVSQAPTPDSPCDTYHPYKPEENQRWALEVTQAGRSALFDVQGTPVARDFDEDSILVQDGPDHAARFRLLQADGTALQLRVVGNPAPAVSGDDVMLIPALDEYRSGMIGPDDIGEQPYLVDDRAGTLQLLDVPDEITWWGSNVDEFLWGGNGCRVTWQQPDGTFDHHDIDCRDDSSGLTDPGWSWLGWDETWLEPGRMALVEYTDTVNGAAPLIVHLSLDRGVNWQRIKAEDGDTLADVLRRLG